MRRSARAAPAKWLPGAGDLAPWALGWWLLWRVPRPRVVPSCDATPARRDPGRRVSVVVPARNEELNIATVVGSLATQAPPPDQLVVVDDESNDGTAELAGAGGALVVSAGPLPDGWTGKAWACAQGEEATDAPVLVFLDADTRLEPGGLARLVAELDAQGGRGLISVQPYHVMERPYEGLSAFFNLVGPMGTGAFTPLGDRASAVGAFGPCLVCNRADYHLAGGHAGVGAAVLDDAALASQFRRAGLPVRLLGGRGTVSFRMYPEGIAQMSEGWTKNMASGAGMVRPINRVLAVAWLAGAISAGAEAVATSAGVRHRPAPAAATLYVAYAAQVHWMLRRVGRFGPLWALAYPVPLAFFLVIFARSAILTKLRGQVRWRGRTIPTALAPQ